MLDVGLVLTLSPDRQMHLLECVNVQTFATVAVRAVVNAHNPRVTRYQGQLGTFPSAEPEAFHD